MRRSALWLVAGLLVAGCARAAPPAVVTVAPARAPEPEPVQVIDGMGPLHVGQTKEEVLGILGAPSSVVSREAEADAFKQADYGTDDNIIFAVGFDELLVYEKPPEGMVIPFWKIYLRGGKVATIVVTAFSWDTPPAEKVGFAPACYLKRDAKGIAATFGPALRTRDKNVNHHYLARGITIVEVRDEIAVFDIYGKLSPADQARIEVALTSGGGAARSR
jgi:hypothetical protein